MKVTFPLFFLFLFFSAYTQSYRKRDIKSFGARGDGKTDDHAAFERAAEFFNKRKGQGKLIISKGTYIVGRQEFTKGQNSKPAYYGYNVLRFENVQNFSIEGKPGAKFKYKDSLRFGAFNPETGLPHSNSKYFVKYAWAAFIGNCILIENSEDVFINNIEMDGNNQGVILGGVYGDVGRQLPHNGIFIKNSKKITVEGIKAHHFALDGIIVSNKESNTNDEIKLQNNVIEYNGRQGLSWIGGNGLKVKGCKFNHTGKGSIGSPPGAGVDIEAEVGPIRGGKFEDCEFINNKGAGLVADNGNSRDCTFKNCTFWGVTTWSIWVTKPAYTFEGCNVYGSFVHGYSAGAESDATKFIKSHFEDKQYEGKEPFGNFLIESNYRKRVTFSECTFVSNKKKLMWIEGNANLNPEEKYQFNKCNFIMNNANLPAKDFVAVMRGARIKDCTFQFANKEAKQKGYYLNGYGAKFNVDEGGNKIVYPQ